MTNGETSNGDDSQFMLGAADLLEAQAARLTTETDAKTVEEVSRAVSQIAADLRREAAGEEADGSEAPAVMRGTPLCSSCYTSYKMCVANGGTDCMTKYNYCVTHCTP